MLGFLRFLLLSFLFYLVVMAVKKIFMVTQSTDRQDAHGRDTSKEVKDVTFKSEDVVDAKFKDVK